MGHSACGVSSILHHFWSTKWNVNTVTLAFSFFIANDIGLTIYIRDIRCNLGNEMSTLSHQLSLFQSASIPYIYTLYLAFLIYQMKCQHCVILVFSFFAAAGPRLWLIAIRARWEFILCQHDPPHMYSNVKLKMHFFGDLGGTKNGTFDARNENPRPLL